MYLKRTECKDTVSRRMAKYIGVDMIESIILDIDDVNNICNIRVIANTVSEEEVTSMQVRYTRLFNDKAEYRVRVYKQGEYKAKVSDITLYMIGLGKV